MDNRERVKDILINSPHVEYADLAKILNMKYITFFKHVEQIRREHPNLCPSKRVLKKQIPGTTAYEVYRIRAKFYEDNGFFPGLQWVGDRIKTEEKPNGISRQAVQQILRTAAIPEPKHDVSLGLIKVSLEPVMAAEVQAIADELDISLSHALKAWSYRRLKAVPVVEECAS
jgi:hypothetical protein